MQSTEVYIAKDLVVDRLKPEKDRLADRSMWAYQKLWLV